MKFREPYTTRFLLALFLIAISGWCIYMFPLNPRFFGFLLFVLGFSILLCLLRPFQCVRIKEDRIELHDLWFFSFLKKKRDIEFEDVEKVLVPTTGFETGEAVLVDLFLSAIMAPLFGVGGSSHLTLKRKKEFCIRSKDGSTDIWELEKMRKRDHKAIIAELEKKVPVKRGENFDENEN